MTASRIDRFAPHLQCAYPLAGRAVACKPLPLRGELNAQPLMPKNLAPCLGIRTRARQLQPRQPFNGWRFIMSYALSGPRLSSAASDASSRSASQSSSFGNGMGLARK